jgi:hypothetical protein
VVTRILLSLLCFVCNFTLVNNSYANNINCIESKNIFVVESNYLAAKNIIFDNCINKIVKVHNYKNVPMSYDDIGLQFTNYKIYKMINLLINLHYVLNSECNKNYCVGIIDVDFTRNKLKNLLLVKYIQNLLNIKFEQVTDQQKTQFKSNILRQQKKDFLLIDSNELGFIALKHNPKKDNIINIDYYKTGVLLEMEQDLAKENINLWEMYNKIYHLINNQIDQDTLKKMRNNYAYFSGFGYGNLQKINQIYDAQGFIDRIKIMNLMTRLNKLSLSDISSYLNIENKNETKFFIQEIVLLYVMMKLFNTDEIEYISQDIILDGYIEAL